MGREGDEVDVERRDVDRHSTDGLHGVGVEPHPVFPAEPADLRDGLDDAGLVVDPHQADDRQVVGPRLEQGLQGIEIDPAIGMVPDPLDPAPLLLQPQGRVPDGGVLESTRRDRRPTARIAEHSSQGEVGGFGATRAEQEVAWATAEKPRHLLAGEFDPAAGRDPVPMRARGIAPVLAEARGDGIDHFGKRGGRRVVVEVGHEVRRAHREPAASRPSSVGPVL